MDYADECQNIWNDEQERLEEIAMKEEEALEELLEDDQAIYELITDYDLLEKLGNAVRAVNNESEHTPTIVALFITSLFASAAHKVEKDISNDTN